MTIRFADAQDIESLAHHRAQMWIDMGALPPDQHDPFVAATAPMIKAKIEAGELVAWIAEDGGETVGGCTITLRDQLPAPDWNGSFRATYVQPLLLNVFVEPTHRRRGIARQLVEAVIDHCKAQGYPNLVLHFSKEGKPLYESLGFKPTNEMRLDL